MGFLGHFISSLNTKSLLREGIKCPKKAHLNGSKGDPQKRHFLTPKMSFSRFSNFDLCRGPGIAKSELKKRAEISHGSSTVFQILGGVIGAHGKRSLKRGWQKRLAKGWHRVGEGLGKGRQRVSLRVAPSNFAIPKRPFSRAGL